MALPATLNVGVSANDGAGDRRRDAFMKIQACLDDLDARLVALLTSNTDFTTALAAKAPLVSPALTGTPTAPTAAAGTNTTQLATTAFVRAAIAALVNSSPSALDTLAELATALGNDANFATTVTNALVLKAPLASPTFTGTPAAPTATAGTNTTQLATTAFVGTAVAAVSGATPAPASPSTNTTLSTADQDQYATGTITLTAPNSGAGWRSGVIVNDNATSGLITLAVPSGATLDGTTNGTTVLYPFQRARIRQTGSTAYRTDWVDRSPIIKTAIVASGSPVANLDFALPVGYGSFELDFRSMLPSTNGVQIRGRLSDDGGSTFKSGASDYTSIPVANQGGSYYAGNTSQDYFFFHYYNVATGSGYPGVSGTLKLYPGDNTSIAASANVRPTGRSNYYLDDTTGPYNQGGQAGFKNTSITTRANGLRIYPASGNFYGGFTLRAVP